MSFRKRTTKEGSSAELDAGLNQFVVLEPASHVLKTVGKTLSASGGVVAGITGQKIYLTALTISCNAALTVVVSWGASPLEDKVIEGGYFAANGGLRANYGAATPVISEVGEDLYCTITGTGSAQICAKYYQE